MLANMSFLGHFPEVLSDQGTAGILAGLADIGRDMPAFKSANEYRRFIVQQSAPGISRLVARDLMKDPDARRLVMISYLTAQDPMAEYREVTSFDYMVALDRAFPDVSPLDWYMEEEEPEAELLLGLEAVVSELDDEEGADEGLMVGDLGKLVSKKMKTRLKKVGKIVAIAAVVVGAVALGVVTGGAALPALASVAQTGFQMSQSKKKATAEKKQIKKAEAELAAANVPIEAPPPGEIAPTMQAAFDATASGYASNPQAQGAVQAQGQLVERVMPQAMASYAAGQSAGRSREELAAELGVPANQISQERLDEANAVAAGAEPSAAGKPGWVLPAAIGGGGLLLALVTGVI